MPNPPVDVAVLLQRLRERCARARHRTRVARERPGELRHRAHSDPVLIAAGQHGRARRRAQRGHVEAVVAQAHLRDPRQVRGRDRPTERVGLAEAGVVDDDEEDVRRVLGRLGPGDDRPVGDRLVERAAHHAAEGPVGDRQHRPVGDELAHRLGETVFERLHPPLVALDDGFRERAGERLLDGEPLLVVEDRNDPCRARREVLADLVVKLRLDPVVDELAHYTARRRTDRRRGEQRGRRQADGQPDAAAPAQALAAHAVARLLHRDAAVQGMRDQDRALDLDLLGPDTLDERVEVLRRGVDVRIAAYEDIGWCIRHLSAPPRSSGLLPGQAVRPHTAETTSAQRGSTQRPCSTTGGPASSSRSDDPDATTVTA